MAAGAAAPHPTWPCIPGIGRSLDNPAIPHAQKPVQRFALPVGDYHTDRVVVATTAPGEAPGDRDATFAVNEAGRVRPIGRVGPSLLGHAEPARLGSSRPRSRYTSGTTASRRPAESRPTSAPGSASPAT